MTSFKFNFNVDCNEQKAKEDVEYQEQFVDCYVSEEIMPKQLENLDDIISHANMYVCNDVEIGHVLIEEAMLKLSNSENSVTVAEKEHSDLISGKYEGGLKIWECTDDLMNYLILNKNNIQLQNKKILDLGCGAGILGIYSLMNGASVTFQDYNKEVLENVTIPNVLLNIADSEIEMDINKCKFYSGDWRHFNELLPETESFDIILTSETIYNPNNYDKLTKIFTKRLKKNGVIFLAAKTYYFGVGGGTRQFEDYILRNNLLLSEVSWKSSSGIQREILKITHNNKS